MQSCQRQVAEYRVGRPGLVQGVPVDPKLDAAGAGAEQRLEHHRQRGLPPVHSGVEKPDGLGIVEIDMLAFSRCCIQVESFVGRKKKSNVPA